MHPALKESLDRFATLTGHKPVQAVLDARARPKPKLVVVRFPKDHPLFHIGAKERD